jgi:predicted molibdopterin-dependent oxidoreductase YjgC
MTNPIEDIVHARALLVIGSNTSETHPVIAVRMRRAVKNGAQLIVADPRGIELTGHADLWLRQRPGTDGALISALCHVILRDGLEDAVYISERVEGIEAFRESVAGCTPEWAEAITGVPAADIEKAAHVYAGAEAAGIYYTMGITQHTSGTDNVCALANLALITGNLGKSGGGINPLRGQNNVQGASDMGCNPVYFPGYQRVDNDEIRKKFEEIWQTPLSGKVGLTATEMPAAIQAGTLKGMWIMGENPVLSDPNANHVVEALKQLDILVVQDIFLTETAELADVVLPAASFAEKDGTFTNTERRVQRIRQAVPPPGGAMDDLSIINQVSMRIIGGNNHARMDAEATFAELCRCWPAMAGMSYERLEEGGLQWPCPDEQHPGTPILHEQGFPVGKARLTLIDWHGPEEVPDEEFPLVLSTGRVLYQYHTGTMTRRSEVLEQAAPGPYVEMNPDDAAELGLADGERVQAVSRRGNITLPVRITDKVHRGLVFMPFHYREAAANLLTNDALDPQCKIPEAKVCAVRIEKIEAPVR